MDTVAILGAGAWGTALAIHLTRTRSTPAIRLWARDATQEAALAGLGYTVLRFWDFDVKADARRCAAQIADALEAAQAGTMGA